MTAQSDMETLARARARLFAARFSMLARRWWATVSVLVFVAYAILLALVPFKHPSWNWDMLAYLAVAQEDVAAGPAELHALVYGQIHDAASAADFAELTDGNEYRKHQAGNAPDFASMLPMYRVKTLYIEAIRLLMPVTGPVMAMRWINAASVLVLLGFVAAGLWKARAPAMAAPAAALLGLSGLAGYVQLGTPDVMSAALLTGGLWFHLIRREVPAALLLGAAFFVRPDVLVFLAVAMAVAVALKDEAWGLFGAFVVALLSYGPLTHAAGHTGWWPHFWFSVVNYEPSMRDFHPAFSVLIYAKAVVRGLARSVIEGGWPLLLGLAAGWAVLAGHFSARWTSREAAIAASCALAIAAKFVLFPIYDGRLYFPLSVIPLLILLGVTRRLVNMTSGGQTR